MTAKREKVHFESVEELLGAPVAKDATSEIRIDQIFPFENHPFKVLDDDRMQELVESIRQHGVLVPVLVRPDDEGTYEMISGHRRMHAAKLAGLVTIPAIIKPMTDDEATIAMVDANMQREEILPSERAFSLKMKMDAMRRQGYRADLTQKSRDNAPEMSKATCGTQFPKFDDERRSREQIGKEAGIGGRQVQKYIRLTELDSRLLDLVDQKRIAIALAVEISYLDKQIQSWIYEYVKDNGFLKKEQIMAVRAVDHPEQLTQYTMIQLMNDALPKPRDTGRVTFSGAKLNKYFPPHFSGQQREEIILKLLQEWSSANQQN
ncbi:MAG: ParB/RepB/Spo0J family partition protein [Lachnospiraceae bacterium]|nr:ParB/RepB/Spo0J family partition protein [Lachnospiraceae bacterium]MDD5860915.1 ParB/RepB/Spo0J family partition protein [Eubacteriales bacterium]